MCERVNSAPRARTDSLGPGRGRLVAAGGRRRRRPRRRGRGSTRRSASLARQDYPELDTVFLVDRHRRPRRRRRRRSHPRRAPRRLRRGGRRQPRVRSRRPTRVARVRRGRQRVLLLLPRRRRPRPRRHPPDGRGAVPLQRRHRRAEARRLGQPARPPERRPRRRSLRSARQPTSSSARTTRSSSTPSPTCSPCRRRACSSRADLFRALGGFDAAMSYHGEDVDLCWRAHISGARVIVAPAARARHREELETRRPDLNHAVLRARHHLRSTLTLTAGSRLPVRLARDRRPHPHRARRRRVHRTRPARRGRRRAP